MQIANAKCTWETKWYFAHGIQTKSKQTRRKIAILLRNRQDSLYFSFFSLLFLSLVHGVLNSKVIFTEKFHFTNRVECNIYSKKKTKLKKISPFISWRVHTQGESLCDCFTFLPSECQCNCTISTDRNNKKNENKINI